MTDKYGRPEDYREVLDPGLVRKRLLMRAAMASGVMLILLAGLVLFGGDESAPEPEPEDGEATFVPSADLGVENANPFRLPSISPALLPQANDVGASASSDATPQTSGAPETQAESVSAAGSDATSEVRAEPADTPPDASVQPDVMTTAKLAPLGDTPADEAQPADTEVPEQQVLAPPTVKPVVVPEPKAEPAPMAAKAETPASNEKFNVRLGTYQPVKAADTLHQSLAARGMPVKTLRRVVVGPYANRKTAESAMAALKALGVPSFVATNGSGSGTGFVLQAGVFSDSDNAVQRQQKLATDGFTASIEGRVEIGPYASRKEAESSLAAARGEFKIAGTIVAIGK